MPANLHELREQRRASPARSISAVVLDVFSNLQDILSSEIRLAKAEARAELRATRSAGTLIVIGALGGLLSAFFLLLSLVAALSLVIHVWLAALLVALGMAVLCAVTLGIGARRLHNRTRPRPLRA